MEAKTKFWHNKMKLRQKVVQKRIDFVQQLKELGHTHEEINKFMGEQFSDIEGNSCDVADLSISTDDEDNSSEDDDLE